jgi:tetratricopeptide (TPR) repeat protein/transcriptional regulator with XRE-family HTH domain
VTETVPLSELMRSHRFHRDLTLEGLAERSGVSGRTISDIERGVSVGPQRRTMVALADGLELVGHDRELFLSGARIGRRALVRDRERSGIAPHRIADFTGRSKEIAHVMSHLTEKAGAPGAGVPVVLSGAPGMGKTSIAVEALNRYFGDRSRILFVDLGGLDEGALQPLQILNEMTAQLTGKPQPSVTVADAVASWNAARSGVSVAIILDDAASESQIRPVLAAGEQMIIVTSRRTLAGLEGVHHVSVGPLPRHQSIDLLREVIPPLQSLGDLDELAELCSDIPLALRIAGNRISAQASWTVEQFVRRLRAEGKRLRTLVAGDLAVEAAFELSYDVLPDRSQALFRDLALLDESTFSALVASAINDQHPHDVEDDLDELADLGLVEMLHGDRYRLHDLLRLFAVSRLHKEVTPDEIDLKKERLARWLLANAAAAGDAFDTSLASAQQEKPVTSFCESTDDAAAWIRAESGYWYRALLLAAEKGWHDDVISVAWSLHWYADSWLAWGHWHELFAVATESARATGQPHWEIEHLSSVAFMQLNETFDAEASLITSKQALQRAREDGSTRQIGWSLIRLASAERALGRPDNTAMHAREATVLLEECGDYDGLLQARVLLAEVVALSSPEEALADYERVLAIVRDPAAKLSEHVRIVTKQNTLGLSARILISLDRPREAIPLANELLDLADVTSGNTDRARAYRHRGIAHAALGLTREARRDLNRAIELAGEFRPDYWYDEIQEVLASLADEDAAPEER